MENKDVKRFDEWTVDCNNCQHYWESTCDGVSEGKKRPCNSYLATRSVSIPGQIESLKSDVLGLKIALWVLCITMVVGWALFKFM